jgi:hypothetical protein
MFNNKLFAFIIPLVLVILTSCGKYEEGPEFTLLTKKQRLIGDWVLEEAMVDGQALNVEDYADYTLTFERDGTAKITYGALFQKGTWEFVDDKKKLRTIDLSGQMTEPTIIRLTNKELWLKDADGDLNKLKAK